MISAIVFGVLALSVIVLNLLFIILRRPLHIGPMPGRVKEILSLIVRVVFILTAITSVFYSVILIAENLVGVNSSKPVNIWPILFWSLVLLISLPQPKAKP